MENYCSVCNNAVGPCRYSDRRAKNFAITLSPGFEYYVRVPCYFKERLKDFATNFLVARHEPGYEFDLYIKDFDGCTMLGGAYWRDFAHVMNLSVGDRVNFNAIAAGCLFIAEVFDENNIRKPIAHPPAIPQVIFQRRHRLHEAIFTDMYALFISEISRIVRYLNTRKPTDNTHRQRHIVHKITDIDIVARRLIIPADVTFWLSIPRGGEVLFYKKHYGESHGTFTSRGRMETVITHGWTRSRRFLGLDSGSTIVLKLKMKADVLWVKVKVISA